MTQTHITTDEDVGRKIWPVPRQISYVFNSSSCPNGVIDHTPCLQNDFAGPQWNESPSCFINHYADNKELVHDVLGMIQKGTNTNVEEEKVPDQQREEPLLYADGRVRRRST